MIRITSQGACHQCDELGREITTWDAKKCAWIVNEEFENSEIDWWGKDNDFPRGETLAQFLQHSPDFESRPDISVIWTWDTKEAYIRAFNDREDAERHKYPYSYRRSWGYLDYSKEEATKQLINFCGHADKASSVKVLYNGDVLYEGTLQDYLRFTL